MKYLATFVFAIALVVLAALGFVYSGIYNVAADQPHWKLTAKLLHDLSEASIEARADSINVPALDNPKSIASGARMYAHMCSGCHLKPGADSNAFREGLNPMPPDLTDHAHDPAEEFWIINHGIKMTGMPAWGGSHSDVEIWALVAFLQQLPSLTPAQYQSMTATPRSLAPAP